MKKLLKLILTTLVVCSIGQAYGNDEFESTLSSWINSDGEEIILSCANSYVGPAAEEKATCSAFVKLVDNNGRSVGFFNASATIPGRSGGPSCCSRATSDAMARCRDAYSRSERAARCVEDFCNCRQYLRQL